MPSPLSYYFPLTLDRTCVEEMTKLKLTQLGTGPKHRPFISAKVEASLSYQHLAAVSTPVKLSLARDTAGLGPIASSKLMQLACCYNQFNVEMVIL